MTYTVNKLAKLSGVSVRTLHFYDEIGLLKPAYYGENKYRYYEQEQLLLLQQILFFRELGFQLNQVQKILASDDFDKIKTLKSHKATLEQNIERNKKLLKTVDKTLKHLRGKTKMRDEELFDSLRSRDSEKQKEYEAYLIDKGYVSQNEIDKSWDKVKDWNKEDWSQLKREGEELNLKLADAIKNNLSVDDPQVQALIRKHYEYIKHFWEPNRETYIGLGKLYCEHPEFRAFLGRIHPDLAEFLATAMKIFAERELK